MSTLLPPPSTHTYPHLAFDLSPHSANSRATSKTILKSKSGVDVVELAWLLLE